MAKGGLAEAYRTQGAATRNVAAKKGMWEGIESTFNTALDVGSAIGLKSKEASTAWDEYESGYEDITGEDYVSERPGFGDKGWLKSRFSGPEGDVRVGDTMFDREDIRGYGEFKSGMKDNPMWSAVDEGSGKTWGDIALEHKKSGIKGTAISNEQLTS